jgi:hypothetical protein
MVIPASSWLEDISNATNVVDERRFERIVNLGSQPPHSCFYYVRAGIKVDIPSFFDNSSAGDNLTGGPGLSN